MTDIKIDKEAVERIVADAIVESAIGDHIRAAVETLLKPQFGTRSVIEESVEKVIREVAIRMISLHHSAKIENAVKERLTDDAVRQFVDRFWQNVFRC